jgi:hypothetical protein
MECHLSGPQVMMKSSYRRVQKYPQNVDQ